MNPDEAARSALDRLAAAEREFGARPGKITLNTYRDQESLALSGEPFVPLAHHRACIEAVAEALRAAGVEVELRMFDAARYRAWLEKKGGADSRQRRAEFSTDPKLSIAFNVHHSSIGWAVLEHGSDRLSGEDRLHSDS